MGQERGLRLGDWIGIAVGLLGIAAGFIFYERSLAEREPSFLVLRERTSIVKSETLKNSSIRVVKADGTPIQGNVSALRFYFWNKGKAPIRGSDIYPVDPLTLTLQGNSEILDIRTVSVSRPKIVRPALTLSNLQPPRSLQLTFDILEENDGFSAQLIYAGPVDAQLGLSGSILGVKVVKPLDSEGFSKEFGRSVKVLWINVALYALAGMIALWRILTGLKTEEGTGTIRAGSSLVRLRFFMKRHLIHLVVIGMFLITSITALYITLSPNFKEPFVGSIPESIR